ncbi:MAG: DUF2490 domain-containing protein [Candidatus Glassbacteria bacterium]
MQRMGVVLLVSLTLSILPSSLPAGKTEHWGEYGLQYNINTIWHIMTDYQMRVRDDIQDYYWWRYEIGPGVRIGKWLDLRVLYRYKPQESSPGKWQVEKNIFIDPTFKLYTQDSNSFDLRTRVHAKLGNVGREYIRIRPRLTHRFNIGWRKCNWYVYNEFWMQVSALGPRDRYNTNWFNTGFKWQLFKNIDLSTYFQYRSDKLPATGKWDHDPVIGTSVMLNFQRVGRYF